MARRDGKVMTAPQRTKRKRDGKRTRQSRRYINTIIGKYKRIYKRVIRLLENGVTFQIGVTGNYQPRDILNLIIFSSLSNISLSASYCNIRLAGRESIPSPDSVIYHISQKPWQEILAEFDGILKLQIEELKRLGYLNEALLLAIDIHDVPRYVKKGKGKRKREDLRMAVRTKKARGTTYAHAIMTVEIVHTKGALTLGFMPVLPLSDNSVLIKKLIQRVKAHGLRIRAVMMDREFYDSDVVRVLQDEGVQYLIPARKDRRIKEIRRKASGCHFYIEENYHFGPKKHGATTNVVVVDTTPLKNGSEEKYFTFITNMKVDTYNSALELARLYSFRWGIETGYRIIEDFRAITCSTLYNVRLFLILMAVVLSNQWILYNILMSKQHILSIKPWREKIPVYGFSFCILLYLIFLG